MVEVKLPYKMGKGCLWGGEFVDYNMSHIGGSVTTQSIGIKYALFFLTIHLQFT
jgi:hypothetical protein